MRMQYFGDSYDIVKKSLINWLNDSPEWYALPMYTHDVTDNDVVSFETFLNIKVINKDVINNQSDRSDHFTIDRKINYLFIDPDTGIKLKPSKAKRSIEYIFAPEIINLCHDADERILLVFDQSVPRGSEKESIIKKLQHFKSNKVFGFGYVSHACFLVLSSNKTLAKIAYDNLLNKSLLPSSRFVDTLNA